MPSLIGNKPNQVPSNGDLGTLAFQDKDNVLVGSLTARGTPSSAPVVLTQSSLLATPSAGSMEFDGTASYFSVASATRGAVPTEQWITLTTAYTLTSQTAAQKLFNTSTNGAVTLPVGTYQFECFFYATSMSATSGFYGFALGGTATCTQSWTSLATKGTGSPSSSVASQTTYNTSASNAQLVSASTNAIGYATIRGVIRVTTAGTIIPQISLSIASAAVVQPNSYFKISPIGNSTVVAIGNWS